MADLDHSVQGQYQAHGYKIKQKHCSILKTVSLTSYLTRFSSVISLFVHC